MIYLILSASSAFFGFSSGLGATTLLRPVLDAVSPLSQTSVALLCTMATLCAALVCAFFALSEPLSLRQEELLILAVGAALGGVLGDLAASRFLSVLARSAAVLLQNALLFTLTALPLVYFQTLSRTLRPMMITRLAFFPVSLLIGLFASFLSFGAEPLTLMLCYLLFDADHDESAAAALTVSLFAMAGKLITMLIRLRLHLPDADVLFWTLPGAIGGSLLTMIPAINSLFRPGNNALLRLSLFTSLINMAAALA
ncbi:MAG: TSUP family transporter [Clostridia bacterium]|nr:TSUP family transporter [Clostridia bacterium]